jgi:hypothetical protein
MINRMQEKVTRGLLLAGVLGFSLLLAGCGSRTQPVEGIVVFKGGEPATKLAGYYVTFESVDQPVSATGVVQPDGTFKVGTYQDGDGALLGKHRVSIGPPAPDYGDNPKSLILPKYNQPQTSGLEVTIMRGINKVTLEVEPARR